MQDGWKSDSREVRKSSYGAVLVHVKGIIERPRLESLMPSDMGGGRPAD
jgi:hypothetical protein